MIRRALFHLRRLIADRHGLLAAGAAAWLLVRGSFCSLRLQRELWVELGAAGLLGALLLLRLLLGRPERQNRRVHEVDRLELGLLLLGSLFVAIQATGGPGSMLQPAAYLLLAYLVGFNARWVGVALTLAAIGYQAALHWAAGELARGLLGPFATRAAFILGFGLAYQLLLQAEVARRRREHRQRLDAEVRSMRDEARDFRLMSSALSSGERGSRAEEEQKLAQGAVESIHQGMFFVLELLKKSLDLQTCVLLWLAETGERLRIKELVTDSRLVSEVPISACAGALGGVIKNRILLNLRAPRHGSRGIPYYAGPEQVGAFVGAPVFEGSHLRGVLCADRREDRPFTPAEEQLMVEATRQVLRAIQAERVFAAVERSKYEHERFYRASTMLNRALTLAEVYDTAFTAAREIVEFDFGAITLYDRARGKHIICRVLGHNRPTARSPELEGAEFGDNAGLCSMVVKNKHFLPAGDDVREREAVVFTRKLRLRGMESLMVLPLIVQDSAIGTFVLAARAASRFPKKTREMLGVISNQVAVSIENAKMYKRMEEMATTDGLTGLPNHRTFQSRLSEMLARAERHGKPLSLVLTDIDKFKNVNDTYGHPVGDAVLKRVAKVLGEQVRKVDLAARYGGEEFAMVLEETDARGAHLFCERLRQEVASQLMTSEKGPFRVSISLGIAAYPTEGNEKQLLVERADQALYAAKEQGRNRTVMYADLQKQSARTARVGHS
jgi:two-component system, cell cycle response regulator